MADYRIELGIGLKDSDFNDIKNKIKSLENDGIKIKLDTNTVDAQIKGIKAQLQGLDNIRIDLGTDIKIDSSVAVKSAQQVGQKIGNTVTKSLKKSVDIDDALDQLTLSLMKKYSVSGDKGSKAFDEIRQAIVKCKNELNALSNSNVGIDEEVFRSSRAVDKVTDAIANQHKAVNNLGKEYVKLVEYINKHSGKVQLPSAIKQEQGDDYRSNRSSLNASVFTTGKGQDFADFITELNGNLGQTIDLTKGEAEAFDELLRKVKLGRQQIDAIGKSDKYLTSTASTEEILSQNGINKEEISNDARFIVSTLNAAEQQIAQSSRESTNIIAQNEEKKQQAYKATTDTVMYHAGIVSKLNKAETNGRFYGSNRGTGYFGTGHYFVDSATKHELDNSPSYRNLPYTSIDISQYDNLFPATTDEIADKLHSFLHNLTRFTQGADFDVSDLFVQFREVFGDTIMDVKEFGSRLDQLKTFMSNSSLSDRSDSVSTQFMKSLGYGGVDTRGTRFADTTYGTVIYDLKEESVLQANITDELQKQGQMLEKINYERGQVFDKETDAKIQSKLDEEIKRKETIAEFEKSFDSTNLDNAYESLGKIESRIKEIDDNINSLNYSLNNLDQEYDDELRELEDLGLDADDIFLMQDKDGWKATRSDAYQDYINELSQEKERLQSEIPSLEETYKRESQLANEAYEQAKQVVEQRYKEAQLAQEAANAVVQSEERKQQEAKETADVFENAARQVQQSNKLISDYAQRTIDNVSSKSIDRAFRVNEDDSIAFKREMENLVSQWTDGRGELTDIKINTSSVYDKETDRHIEEITRAQVSYNNELGETIKKTIAWRQIGTDVKMVDGKEMETPVMGFVEVAGQYSKSLGKTKVQTDAFVKQQKQAVSNLTNQINQLNRAASDQNATRPIKDTSHLDTLKAKYNEITSAIQKLENASTDTFSDEQNNVRTLISEYKSLVSELRNAENVSSKMKGTDFDSGLDIAKNDLEKFKAQAKDFPQITATIKELDKAIENVGDVSSLNKFNDQLRVARSELAKVKSETTAINRSEKVGINVSGLESKIADLQRISPEIDKFETEIDGAKVSVQSLLSDLKKVNTQGDFSVINSKFKAFSDAAKAAGIAVTDTVAKAKSALANDIKLDISLGNFENQMDAMEDKFNRLSDANIELRNSLDATKDAYNAMLNAADANTGDEVADRERLIQAEKEYHAALEKTNNLIKIQARADRKNADEIRLQDNRDKFQAKIDTWMAKNSAATKQFGDKLLELRAKAEKADQVNLNHLETELYQIDKAADKAGLKMQSFGDRITTKAKEYMAYLSVAEVFMYATQTMKDMFEQVKLIDSAMTELKKVTDETDAVYNQFLSNASSRAKEIGTTIDGLVSSTADFARLGYSVSDSAELAEVANIYAVVGDEIDSVETATKSLISTMTAFGIEASDSMSIVDKFNIIGNNFAISSGGIGDALERSASSMAAANNSLDETIALITAANTVVQDADAVGTAFKTISMRIRGATTQLEEAGLDTEGMASSTAKLREEIMALSGVDIMLDNTTFKSTYSIMEELANKWEHLTDIQQASITELIAGRLFARMYRNVYKEYI